MNTFLINIVAVIQVISALVIVALVLLQHGKGADMGAAFGSGASGSLFGASGSSNFMSKSTGVAAAVFFAATLGLAYMSSNRHASVSAGALDSLPTQAVPAPASSAPVVPAGNASASAASAPAATVPAAAASAPAASADQGAKTAPASAPQANQIPK